MHLREGVPLCMRRDTLSTQTGTPIRHERKWLKRALPEPPHTQENYARASCTFFFFSQECTRFSFAIMRANTIELTTRTFENFTTCVTAKERRQQSVLHKTFTRRSIRSTTVYRVYSNLRGYYGEVRNYFTPMKGYFN
ncbi:hypothetical protein MTO96_024100 [Rhipicephalus appendiculatus]